ncbi:MAG: hypothetical protein ACRENG_06540, partial [bacterium]
MLWRLLDLGKLVLPESDIDRVLTRMIDYLVDISGVKRGMIILFDEGREILVMPSRHANEEWNRSAFFQKGFLRKGNSTPHQKPCGKADGIPCGLLIHTSDDSFFHLMKNRCVLLSGPIVVCDEDLATRLQNYAVVLKNTDND